MNTTEVMMITRAAAFDNNDELGMKLVLGRPHASKEIFMSQASLEDLIDALKYNWIELCGVIANLERQLVLVEYERGFIVRIGDPFGNSMVEVTDWDI